MIDVQEVRKSFGDTVAVDGVTFSVRPGEIFGLLGPNGAGKTTTINCISGLMQPSSGTVRVLGHDVVRDGTAARQTLGVVPQDIALYDDLSAEENLAYWGGAYGLRGGVLQESIRTALELTGLSDRAGDQAKNYSGGMKRRLNFACGIIHKPRVLVLDEPTVGVDPQSRGKLLDLVRTQARNGACVLYTTHYMDEAENLCDRLAIIDHGRIIASGTLAELRAKVGERDLLRLTGAFDGDAVRLAFGALEGIDIHHCERDTLLLSLEDASSRLPAIFGALERAGAVVRGTNLRQPSLENLFVSLTGRELRD